MSEEPEDDNPPTVTCPECGEVMRLVGIERDTTHAELHLLTFECRNEHVATTTFPN
jgi:predicted nucleic acid-binding Zn ribbon protein